jgi:hypothetical protein
MGCLPVTKNEQLSTFCLLKRLRNKEKSDYKITLNQVHNFARVMLIYFLGNLCRSFLKYKRGFLSMETFALKLVMNFLSFRLVFQQIVIYASNSRVTIPICL